MWIYPFTAFFKERMFTTDALWNDLIGHGFPTFLTSGYIFNPVHVLSMFLFNPIDAVHVSVFASMCIGAVLATQLMREESVDVLGALLGGTMFSVILFPWIFEPGISVFLIFCPALLLCQRRILVRPVVYTLSGAALIALSWLSNHIHYAVILLCVAFLYECVLVVRATTGRQRWTHACSFFGMVVIGTLGGLPRILPILALGKLSLRAVDGMAFGSLLRTVGWNLPFYYILPDTRIPVLSGSFELLPYIGSLPLALAIIGFVKGTSRTLVRSCAFLIILGILFAIPHSPLQALLGVIPPLRSLGGPARWMILATLGFIGLTTTGFSVVVRTPNNPFIRKISLLFGLTGTVLIAGMAAASLAPVIIGSFSDTLGRSLDVQLFEFFAGQSAEWHAGMPPSAEDIRMFVLEFLQRMARGVTHEYGLFEQKNFFPVLGMLMASIALSPWFNRLKNPSMRTAALLGTAACTIVMVLLPRLAEQSLPRSSLEIPSDITAHLLKEDGVIFGFLPIAAIRQYFQLRDTPAQHEVDAIQQSFFMPNTQQLWGLMSADLYDPLRSKRMGSLLALIGGESVRMPPSIMLASAENTIEEKIAVLRQRSAILDALNISRLVSVWPLEQAQWEREFQAAVSSDNVPIGVYRNATALPFAYFPSRVLLSGIDADQAIAFMRDKQSSDTRVLIECEECSGERIQDTRASLSLRSKTASFIEIAYNSPDDRWLVVSQANLPGWKAMVDDRVLPPATAHAALTAYSVPAGDHVLILRFNLSTLLRDSFVILGQRDAHVWR